MTTQTVTNIQVMVTCNCQLDRIKNYLGDGHLGMFMGTVLIKFTNVGRPTVIV